LVFAVAALLLPESGKGSVVFKPGQKAKYVAPGEEEIAAMLRSCIKSGKVPKKQATLNARSKLTKVSLNITPKIHWHPVRFIAALNYRNSSTNTHQLPNHLAS